MYTYICIHICLYTYMYIYVHICIYVYIFREVEWGYPDVLSKGLFAHILPMICVAVYCSVLQCVAVCCSVLQCVAVCCSRTHSHIRASVGDLGMMKDNSYDSENAFAVRAWIGHLVIINTILMQYIYVWEHILQMRTSIGQLDMVNTILMQRM